MHSMQGPSRQHLQQAERGTIDTGIAPPKGLAEVRPGSINTVGPQIHRTSKVSHFCNLLDCLPAGDVLEVQPLHICLCPLPAFANSCAKETLQAKNLSSFSAAVPGCQALRWEGPMAETCEET